MKKIWIQRLDQMWINIGLYWITSGDKWIVVKWFAIHFWIEFNFFEKWRFERTGWWNFLVCDVILNSDDIFSFVNLIVACQPDDVILILCDVTGFVIDKIVESITWRCASQRWICWKFCCDGSWWRGRRFGFAPNFNDYFCRGIWRIERAVEKWKF